MPRLLRKSGDTPRKSLWQRIKDVALTDVGVLVRGGVRDGSLEALEQLLLEADFGVPVTARLVADSGATRAQARHGARRRRSSARRSLTGIEAALRAGNGDPAFVLPAAKPAVLLVIGVNGAGKTTFIGKLAARLRARRQAGDGRARGIPSGPARSISCGYGRSARAASSWGAQPGTRSGGGGVRRHRRGDGARRGRDDRGYGGAAAHQRRPDGRAAQGGAGDRQADATARRTKRCWCSTARSGRTPSRRRGPSPSAVPVTGLVVTKLDGTAKGGVVVAVHEAIDVPVKFLGTGEAADDLAPFDPAAFARSCSSVICAVTT